MTFEEIVQQEREQKCVDKLDQLRRDIMAGNITDLEPKEEEELPAYFKDIHDQLCDALEFVNEVNGKIEEMKKVLYQAMESANMKKWYTDRIIITYVAPTTRKTFDAKAFKAAQPDIYDYFLKESETKGSVRITLKNQEKY